MQQLPSWPTPRVRASLAATLLIAGTLAIGAGANLVRIDSTCATSEVNPHVVVIENRNGTNYPTHPCTRLWDTAPQGYGLVILGAALCLLGGMAAYRRVSPTLLLGAAAATFAALAIFYAAADGYCSDPRAFRQPGMCLKGAPYHFGWETRGVGIALGAFAMSALALIPFARRRASI